MPFMQTKYDYGIGYEFRWLEPCQEKTVQAVMYYSKGDVLSRAAELKRQTKVNKEIEVALKAWETYYTACAEVQSEVDNAVWEARRQASRVEDAKAKFAEFLGISNGDRDIAATFFRKQFNGNSDLIESVLGVEKSNTTYLVSVND